MLSSLEEAVQAAYDENRRVYGQRKLKRILFRKGWTVSWRKIGRIMKSVGLYLPMPAKRTAFSVHLTMREENTMDVVQLRNEILNT